MKQKLYRKRLFQHVVTFIHIFRMHSLRLQHELDELGWAIKMRWPTICIKNRTNIYSYAFTYIHAALKVPVREKRKKKYKKTHTFLALTFYWHTEKENAQIWYSNFSFFHFFWSLFIFFYWYWYWLLFFSGTFLQPYRICLDSLHKENHNDLSIRKFERAKCKQLKDIWEIPTVRGVQFLAEYA